MNSDSKNFQQAKPYDIFILTISILSLYPAIRLLFKLNSPESNMSLLALDWIFSIIFTIDFFLALAQAPSKRQYLKWGWIDFLGSLPVLSVFRPLRLIRVVRIIRILNRTGIRDVINLFVYQPAQSMLWLTASFIMFLLVISSILILRFEGISKGSNITNEYDALWWTIVTISTVGYGDHVPITQEGRTLAIVLMLTGVSSLGVLTSYLSSSFIDSTDERQDQKLQEISQELAEIKTLLYAIQSESNHLDTDSADEHP